MYFVTCSFPKEVGFLNSSTSTTTFELVLVLACDLSQSPTPLLAIFSKYHASFGLHTPSSCKATLAPCVAACAYPATLHTYMPAKHQH